MPPSRFKPSELIELPNLVSLSRVVMGPLMLVALSYHSTRATLIAATLMILAGVSDGLDGYLARRRHQITSLGVALDPIADKLFALFLLVGLFLFREIPVWLLAVLLGRDLLILIGGVYLTRKFKVTLPSNITGKYTFAAISVLLGAYVIDYQFGIELMIPITVALSLASLVSYVMVFRTVYRGLEPKPFPDPAGIKSVRIGLTVLVSAVFLFELFREYFFR